MIMVCIVPMMYHFSPLTCILHTVLITTNWYWGGPCSGCWFLVRFSDLILGSNDNGFIQERGVGCNSVPGQGLDSCVVVWLSFLVAVLVGPFVAVLVVVLLFAFV